MTLDKLIKTLKSLRQKHGNVNVCADTLILRESCNDTWNIVDIGEVEFALVPRVDGDGFITFNKDGTDRLAKTVVLK